ncbi:family 43 glycosylhydrolase [Leifsonia shinshuensis]|uniref:family 43 glycosylhydrolase n=1 Tax=Leifsonia shinshuensis TaxID=150026 RepID=UPI0028589DE9|nr:family 43 glycosylhydrolase [Leifsonia shinshuensis]MDR6972682.1 hypothetical protein [Leifsonia shinshuensis]
MKSPRRHLAVLGIVSAAVTTIALVSAPASATVPAGPHISNDTVWRDTSGNEIRAQGGNVFKNPDDGLWYWVGAEMNSRYSGQQVAKSINLYSSGDLQTWTFRKHLVTQSDDPSQLNVTLAAGADPDDLRVTSLVTSDGSSWLGRPQLIHSPQGKWIIWVEVNGDKKVTKADGTVVDLGTGQAVFESDTIDGTYEYLGKQYVHHGDGSPDDDYTSGDRSVFVEGGNAYLVYVGDSHLTRNVDLNIAPLSSDWRTVGNPQWTIPDDVSLGGQNRHEAPGIVKVGATYYLFASGMEGFNATPTSYLTSSDLVHWSSSWKPVTNAPSSTVDSFGTQFESIVPIVGSSGTSYLYNGDRFSQYYPWVDASKKSQFPSGTGRKAWYPLTFDAGVPTLHGATDVYVDAGAGTMTWNAVANGRFDQRNVADTRNTTTNHPGNTPNWTVSGSAHLEATGSTVTNQQMVIDDVTTGGKGVFSGYVSQQLTLPAGSYDFSFDYKSSGTASHATASVSGASVSAPTKDLTAAATTFTRADIAFTLPSAGVVTIKVQADGSTGYLDLDNVSVLPQ